MRLKLGPLDALQAAGFTLSVLVPTVLIVAGRETIQSVSLGFILATLTQLFDLQVRHAATEERLLQASALSRALYSDEWLLERMRDIVEDYATARERWSEPFVARTRDVVSECRTALHEMAEGKLSNSHHTPYALSAEAFQYARKSLKTVVSADITNWRNNARYQRYLQSFRSAAARNVEVVRIFVQPPDRLITIMGILEDHRAAGVRVYALHSGDVSSEYHQEYVIMDDQVVSLLESGADGQVVRATVFVDEVECDHALNKFGVALRHATKLEDYPAWQVLYNPATPTPTM
jgi:hypothetical protein